MTTWAQSTLTWEESAALTWSGATALGCVAVIGDVTYYVEADSVSIQDRVEERTPCTFSIITSDGVRFAKGQTVELYLDGVRLFAGVIDTPAERYWAPDYGLVHRISCIDWHYLADRRNVARGFTNVTVGSIVQTLITDILAADGIVAGNIDAGPLVETAQFNYVPVSVAMDRLAEQAGFWWAINADKQLHFRDRAATVAPWNVTTDVDGVTEDLEAPSVRVEHRNPDYRNRQFIRGGRDITDPQTEGFRGDGDTQTFTVGFPVAKEPTVTIDGITQTVGVRGIDDAAARDFYWSYASPVVSQRNGAVPPASGALIEITYQGLFDIVVVSKDQEAINDRVAVEGFGTGIVDHVAEEPELSTRTAAFELAARKLEKFAVIGRKITYTTDRAGLAAGQLQTVTIPRHGLDAAEMLIESVGLDITGAGKLRYTVTAVEGPIEGSWVKFFGRLAAAPKTLVFRENISEEEVLVRLFSYSRTWVAADRPNMFLEPLPDGTWLADGSVTPGFEHEDRIRYIQWHMGDLTTGRKIITQRTGLTSTEVGSVSFIAPAEANGTVVELSWWGGFNAEEAVGSGVEVGRVAVNEPKNTAEAWQVERTDTKGWV